MLQVLFLAANSDVSRLSLERESREVQEVFQLSPRRDRFTLHTRTDVRWRDLRRSILEVRPAIPAASTIKPRVQLPTCIPRP